MKRKSQDDIQSQSAAKKPKLNESMELHPPSGDGINLPMDIWRSIEYFCDMPSLPQLNMTCKAFLNFGLDSSYKKLYIWRWKSNLITAEELKDYTEYSSHDDLIEELTNESQFLFTGCSNFLHPTLSSMSWKSKYFHRLSLLPNEASADRIYASKEEALSSKISIYDRSSEQHEQEEQKLVEYMKQQEALLSAPRGRRAQLPRDADPLTGLPESLEFIFIGPSAAPILIKTAIQSVPNYPMFFKASVWSYLTSSWCDLLVFLNTGSETREDYYPICYPVISLLYGRNLGQNQNTAEFFCEQFRQLVIGASQLPRGSYANTSLCMHRNDPSMEDIFE